MTPDTDRTVHIEYVDATLFCNQDWLMQTDSALAAVTVVLSIG
jgi:hypothetical protein